MIFNQLYLSIYIVCVSYLKLGYSVFGLDLRTLRISSEIFARFQMRRETPKGPEAWLASPHGRNLFMAYWNFCALPAAIFKIQ